VSAAIGISFSLITLFFLLLLLKLIHPPTFQELEKLSRGDWGKLVNVLLFCLAAEISMPLIRAAQIRLGVRDRKN
jgi:hypothetical protein